MRADLIGRTFGRWTVVKCVGVSQFRRTQWLCRCACGNTGEVDRSDLTTGHSRSCGCISAENRTVHGLCSRAKREPAYWSWAMAKQRCTNPKYTGYKNWGGRGIRMCDRWMNSFASFFEDMGPRPVGCSLDRIDNDGHYEPVNCRWATQSMQIKNSRRRGVKGLSGAAS